MAHWLRRLVGLAPRAVLVVALALLAVPVSVAAVFFGRGSVGHLLLATIPALVVAPALIAAGVALWLVALRSEEVAVRRRLRWLAAALVGLAAFALVVAPSYLPGLWLNYRDVAAAKRYCNDLVPRLEAWRDEHGAYPPGIEPVRPAERPLPRLLRRGTFYHRLGGGYEFVFLDPARLVGGYSFFSPDTVSRGRWETWD